MKKVLTLVALLGAASVSFGQGFINFANTTGTRISTNGTANANAGGAVGTWYYALFQAGSANTTAPAGSIDPSSAGWTLVAIGTNAALAGTLSGNTGTDGRAVSPGASTMDYAVAGWSANIGVNWAAVQSFFGNSTDFTQQSHTNSASAGTQGWYGLSTTFADNIAATPTGLPLNGIFGTSAGLITGFGLQNFPGVIVPEPATFALAGLGAAALVIFRRRRN